MIFELNQLGQAPTPSSTSEAIGAYVAGLRDSVLTSKASAVSAYNTLKSVRTNLGLPFMSTAGEGGDQNGWSPDLEQQAIDVTAMANILTAAADDVLAQKRKLYWDDQLKNFAVEGFTTDVLRIQLDANGVPVLVDAGGSQQHITGQVSAAPLVVFGVVAALVVVQALLIYLLVDKALQTLQVIAEQQTQKTLAQAAKKHADLVAQGKATADDAAKLNKSMYEGATELQKQSTSAQAAKKGFESDTLKTLGYIALGIGILYAIVKLVPAFAPSSRMAPATPLALNPRREPPDETAADELEIYIDNDARFAIQASGSQGAQVASNLWKKWKKGTYDSSKAPKAWKYMVENAARAYAKEFSNSEDDWKSIFNPATRDAVAQSLTQQFEMFARDGTFDRYPPKPFTGQVFGRLPPAA